MAQSGYCIFVDTLCGGMTPVWRDEQGKWIVYKTEAEAIEEVMDLINERFRQYLDGERELEDVAADEDIICKVTQLPDGSVVDEWGQVFAV
jgi:hypothetical protein